MSVSLAGLFLTGIWLFFHWEPVSSWRTVHLAFARAVVILHWSFAIMLIVSVVSLLVTQLRLKQWLSSGLSTISLVVTVVAVFVGLLLPWDVIASYAMQPRTGIDGFEMFFQNGRVKFVVLDGSVIKGSSMASFVATHILLLLPIAGLAFGAQKFMHSRG